MKEFLYDMHVHTAESSSCAHVPAADVVERYKALGYDGVVITDHMSQYKMKRAKCESIEEKAEYFLRGWREAKKYEDDGFSVILGMELSFLDYNGDFLVYGIDETATIPTTILPKSGLQNTVCAKVRAPIFTVTRAICPPEEYISAKKSPVQNRLNQHLKAAITD